MHLYKTKRTVSQLGILAMVMLFMVFMIYFYSGITSMSDEVKTSDAKMLQNALENAVVTCYAIEGSYPESLEYIEEHYGIVIDREKYLVDYQSDMINMKPVIAVYTIETDN